MLLNQVTQSSAVKVNYFDLIAACGGESLHPGGATATRQLLALSKIAPGLDILEVGCGSGYTSCLLAKEWQCRVIGIDINPIMIHRARTRALSLPAEQQPSFQTADARTLPLETASVDRIICEGCTSFMPNKERVAQEYFRTLRPRGLLGELEFYYREYPPADLLVELNAALPGYHLENWSAQEWHALYENIGFHLIDTVDFGYQAVSEQELSKSTDRFLQFYLEHPVDGLPHQPSVLREYFDYYQRLFNRNRAYLGYRLYAFEKPS